MNKKPQPYLIPLAVCCIVAAGILCRFSYSVGIAVLAASLVCLLISWSILSRYHREQAALMDDLFHENATAAGKLIFEVSVPCMIFDPSGRIIWRNRAMRTLYEGAELKHLPAACTPKNPRQTTVVEYNGSVFQVINLPVEREHGTRELIFQYWLDRSEAAHYQRLYEEQLPRVALIYVDNFEELTADLQFHRNTVLTEVEKLVAEMATSIEGVYRRYDNGRFLLIFENQYLPGLEKERFALLEKAHTIDTGTEQMVTLSIAVGAAPHVRQADESARQAMELALGRGGDQAVVKNGTNYNFYGGRRQMETRQSRVKSRLFAKALHQLFENATEVFIMGHKQPDMDCLGAALGIFRCAKQVGCKAYILLDQSNPSIQQAVDGMRQNKMYEGVFIGSEAMRSQLRSSSVLVVVDTQRASSTMLPDMVERASKLVLIDHHRRSADYIDNATLNYLEARASSASEMVTETLQYFDDAIRPTAFECSALLAGITLDTKHFAFNVGARTFEAAGYLRKNGADISAVKLMFQDDRQAYADRVDVVKNATLLNGGVAISICPPQVHNAFLISAQAADELIGIKGIEAAFVLGTHNGRINISGRSLGRINVQMVLEKLGGGGHLTMAGAQLADCTMEEAVVELKRVIAEYLQENPN